MSRFSRARQVTNVVDALQSKRGDCPCMRRVLPPIPAQGCVEPKFSLTDVLSDPGFETTTNPIPELSTPAVPYFQDFDPPSYPQRGWEVSTANPRTGSDHLRMPSDHTISPNTGGHTAPGDSIYVAEFIWCDNPAYAWGFPSRADPGDIFTFSLWSMAGATTDGPRVWTGLYTVDSAGNYNGLDTSTSHVLTTSYAQYSTNITCNAGTKYILAYIGSSYTASFPTYVNIDVDDLGFARVA